MTSKYKYGRKLKTIFCISFVLLFSSCFGVNMDIVMNQNGSGNIGVEYRISKSLDSLGELDGNEKWNTIPVGRADFERTIDRLPGMKLVSFSSREDEKDLVIMAKMEFQNIDGLIAFLDASGRRISFSGEESSGRMILTLSEGVENSSSALTELTETIFDSYFVRMSMTFPGEGNLTLLNNQGSVLRTISGSEIQDKGKKVSCSLPLGEVLASTEGIKAEFQWR